MATVAGPAAPSPTAHPVLRFSRRWARALTGSGLASGTVPELADRLRPLTVRLARAVQTGEPDPGLGHEVGAALLGQGYGGIEVIGPTVRLLGTGLVEEFGTELEGWPPDDVVAERVAVLAGAVAQGL